MTFEKTPLNDCYVITCKSFGDSRGFFMELYKKSIFDNQTHQNVHFIQDNIAKSSYGVIRGLHMQLPPKSQAKLVYCLEGKILDVAVDVRENSPTFGQSFAIELSWENKKQLFVPKGFLHGYSVLSETAIVAYKCDDEYAKETEMGVTPLDTTLNINWGIPEKQAILSEKDINAISFKDLKPVQI